MHSCANQLRDGLSCSTSCSSQNLCHVCCSHWQGLIFCTVLGICIIFDNIKFFPAILHLEMYLDRVFYWSFKILHSFFCCFIKTQWISSKKTSQAIFYASWPPIPRSQRVQVHGKGIISFQKPSSLPAISISTSAKINFSYSILFHLIPSYSILFHLIPSYSILFHLIPLILGVRRE